MLRAGWTVAICLLLAAAGCKNEQQTTMVSANPFEGTTAVVPRPKVDLSPASVEAAQRVDMLGRKLIAANPQAGVGRPMFRTIGAPQPEIFHRGTQEVDITEGLVRQCTTDGQLAAILCMELGKMVAEREVKAGPALRQPERRPPIDVPVGNDSGGSFGAPDGTRLAELGMYEKTQRSSGGTRAASEVPVPPPDPDVLAKSYLKKAEFPETELDNAGPLLAAAAQNSTFEKQFIQASWRTPSNP